MEQDIEKLNERLEKAAKAYKDVKAQLDAANATIEELNNKIASENPNQPTVDAALLESLQQKVKDYEDELAINGNASEEIAKLNERLNKAKEIFAEQKKTISDLREELTTEKEIRSAAENANKLLGDELTKTKDDLAATVTSFTDRLNKIAELSKI